MSSLATSSVSNNQADHPDLDNQNTIVTWNGRIITHDQQTSSQETVENTLFKETAAQLTSNEDLGTQLLEKVEELVLETGIAEESIESLSHPEPEKKSHKKKYSKSFFGRVGHALHKVEKEVRHGAHQLEKNVRHGLHKSEKYARHHKKDIAIGAAIVAVVAIAILATPATGGAAAAAGAGATAAISNNRTKPINTLHGQATLNKPSAEQTKPKTESNLFASLYDNSRDFKYEGIRNAEIQAKEIRHPYLVHSSNAVIRAQNDVDSALENFGNNIKADISHIKIQDIGQALQLGIDAKAASQTTGLAPFGLVVDGVMKVNDLVGRSAEELKTLYEPVGKVYAEFNNMDRENREASLAKCEAEGYKPVIEFHPEGSTDVNRTRFIDKNNPNPHEITAVIHED